MLAADEHDYTCFSCSCWLLLIAVLIADNALCEKMNIDKNRVK